MKFADVLMFDLSSYMEHYKGVPIYVFICVWYISWNYKNLETILQFSDVVENLLCWFDSRRSWRRGTVRTDDQDAAVVRNCAHRDGRVSEHCWNGCSNYWTTFKRMERSGNTLQYSLQKIQQNAPRKRFTTKTSTGCTRPTVKQTCSYNSLKVFCSTWIII